MSSIWDVYKCGNDPFYTEPLGKAHYHPSPKKNLDGLAKQSLLSPKRDLTHHDVNNKENVDFLNGANAYRMSQVGDLGWSPHDNSASLDESWPQSEQPSSLSNPIDVEAQDLTPPTSMKSKKVETLGKNSKKTSSLSMKLDFGDGTKQKSSGRSVVSKYIDRFRNEAPKSREDRLREQSVNPNDFWWMASQNEKKPDGIPSHETNEGRPSERSRRPGKKQQFQESSLDEPTRLLQQRADQLIERAASSLSLSSCPAVSTVGLGSDLTSTGSTIAEESYRPAFIHEKEKSSNFAAGHSSPKDDILQQWRRRRKIELAKERVVAAGNISKASENFTQNQESTLASFRQRLADRSVSNERPAYSVNVTSDQQSSQPPHLSDKRDATIQTTEDVDRITYRGYPILCPHTAVPPSRSGCPAVAGPHFHRQCDILDTDLDAPSFRKDDGISLKQRDEITKSGPSRKVEFEKNKLHIEKESEKYDSDISLKSKEISEFDIGSNSDIPEKDNNESDSFFGGGGDAPGHRICEETSVSRERSFHRKRSNLSKHSGAARMGNVSDLQSTRQAIQTDKDGRMESRVNVDGDERKNKRFETRADERVHRDRKPPVPKRHSSPSLPARINSTTEEAIEDAMFTSVSVISSVSVLSSLEDIPQTGKESTRLEFEVGFSHDGPVSPHPDSNNLIPDFEALNFSDGEEFNDDDMLRDLRHRRDLCLRRLQELDELDRNDAL